MGAVKKDSNNHMATMKLMRIRIPVGHCLFLSIEQCFVSTETL